MFGEPGSTTYAQIHFIKISNYLTFVAMPECMRPIAYLFLLLLLNAQAVAQCLTDLKKILPDRNTPKTALLAEIGGDYLVVNSQIDDTLNMQWAGAAYVYRQEGNSWDLKALLKPSKVERLMGFGAQIDIDSLGNTIIASKSWTYETYVAVYVFNMPAAGWNTMTESEEIILKDTSDITAISISPDGLTLAVGQKNINSSHGLVTVYTRTSLSASFQTSVPVRINGPAETLYYGTSLDMDKRHLIVGTERQSATSQPGKIYVYQLPALDLVASLTATNINGAHFGFDINIKNDLIISSIEASSLPSQHSLLIYKKPAAGGWVNANESAVVDLHPSNFYVLKRAFSIIDADHIAASIHYANSEPVVGIDTYGLTEVLKTNVPGNWTSFSRTVLLQEQLPSGGLEVVYGSDLACKNDRIVVTPTNNPVGIRKVNTITGYSGNGILWNEESRFFLPGPNSAQHQYGYDIVRTKDALFVASPFDSESAENAGAVYIYSKNNSPDWIRLAKITPPFTTMRDPNFGVSIDASDSMLAVGTSDYGTDKSKVYVYKRTGPYWNNSTLLQQINTTLSRSHFGENVAINEKLLVIGFIDFYNPQNELMGIEIYERKSAGYVFSKRLNFRKGYSRLEPVSVKIQVRNDSIFLYEGVSYIGEPPSTLKIYTKKANTGWSESSSFELPEGVAHQNIKFDVQNNHVFIGSPLTTVQGKKYAGAVVVYAKLPGSTWPLGTIKHSSIIYSSEIKENSFFGYDVSNIENTLVIGAPENYDFLTGESGGIYHNLVGQVREVSGAVYVFESSDYYWKNALQLLKLQGSFFNQQKWDGAGLSVDSDHEHYFFGAPTETNEHGFWAGAVYTIPTAPLVKLLPPVCVYNEPVKLQGYPFGGVWSGVGVHGETFDPFEAGPGKHLLVYKTQNCAYEGKLAIEVIQNPEATVVGPLAVHLCPEIPVTLAVLATQGATYQWYFRAIDATDFIPLPSSNSTTLSADKAGVYYCTVTYGLCSINSSFINVLSDTASGSSGPQPVICTEGEAIQLLATPPGGQWSGTGVINTSGIFSAQNLAAGIYPLAYAYTSPAGCNYLLKDTVRIGTIQLELTPAEPFITACEGTGVTLTLRDPQPETIYIWLKKEGENFIQASTDVEFQVNASGSYKLKATSMYCEGESSMRTIEIINEDSLWVPNVFSPNNDGFNDRFLVITNKDDYTFQILNRYGQEVFESIDHSPWDGGNHPSGQYFWIVRYTTCSGIAKTKKGWVHKVN